MIRTDIMPVTMPERVRTEGYASLADHDWDLEVLDLSFDSLLDSPTSAPGAARQLRFASGSCTVEAKVRGRDQLTVEILTRPAGRVVIAARNLGRCGLDTIIWPGRRQLTALRPGLTTFLLHWPHAERGPARTAWLVL